MSSATSNPANSVIVSNEVQVALSDGRPVVALESTIFSELGLPFPANREALKRVLAAIEGGGAVPALTAILDGAARVGLVADEYDRVCGPAQKVAARDLGPSLAQGLPYGATTVSAALTLAQAVGVRVFATGGIGGVHHGWSQNGDISADLPTLARHPIITVTAGAKVFLDLGATVEYLETASVPVLGWRTDFFPAFHAPRSPLALRTRVETGVEVAAAAQAHWDLGGRGVVVAVPVPEADGIDFDVLEGWVSQALASLDESRVAGPGVTPLVLEELGRESEGRTVTANLALAENNAHVAAEVAVELARGNTK